MKKLLTILIPSIMFLNACDSAIQKKCRDYAKQASGHKGDAYEYCIEREENIKNFGKPLDDFIKQK